MTTVPVYSADVYLTGSLDEAVKVVRQRVILIATKQERSNERGLKHLRWPEKFTRPIVEGPIAMIETGDIIAIIPLVDVSRLSFFQFGKCVERIAITAVEHLGSNYDIAKFFDLDGEYSVRRAKKLQWAEFWVRAWVTGCAPS